MSPCHQSASRSIACSARMMVTRRELLVYVAAAFALDEGSATPPHGGGGGGTISNRISISGISGSSSGGGSVGVGVGGGRQVPPEAMAPVGDASFRMTNRCGGTPEGHPTLPMAPSSSAHGVEIVYGGYNITVCNNTAWTYRSLWHGGAAVLTPTGFTQTVTNVNLPKHPCSAMDTATGPRQHRRATGRNWTQCSGIFTGCPAVGLVEGGADVTECEAKCESTPNCTAFNVRMVKPGGCSLRHCPPGTLPTGEALPTFASYASYPLKCEPWKPPAPGHTGGKPCSETTTALWPPLRPVAQPIIPITPCGAGWGVQPGLPGGSPNQGNGTCSGFLGTGHGGEYVFSVSLHAGGEVIDLLRAPPTASKLWLKLQDGISIIKESQLGGYLATQNVTLSSSGMTVSSNYTLAYENTLHHINCESQACFCRLPFHASTASV